MYPADNQNPSSGFGDKSPVQPSPARGLRFVGAALCVAFISGAFLPNVHAATAKRSYDFTNAVGIRMDLSDASNYTTNFSAIGPAVSELKIKYVRTDGKNLATNAATIGRMNTLNSTYGIKYDLVFGAADQPTTPMQNSINSALHLGTGTLVNAGAILAFEGPNEWSKHYYQDHDDGWSTDVQTFQHNFAQYLSTRWSGPVLAPTVWKRDPWAYGELNALNVQDDCNRGTIHYYNGYPKKPTESGHQIQTAAYTGHLEDCDMDTVIAEQKSFTPTYAQWVTETGDATGAGGEVSGAFSTTLVAKYVPRLLAEFFNRGIEKTFVFELMDAAAGNYGLMSSTATKRDAFYAMKNLMTILDDPTGSSFTPGSLNYSLNGATGVQTLLLQKANGHFYLLLWQDIESHDADDQNQVVTLSWDFTASSVNTYLPYRVPVTPFTADNRDAVTALTNRTQINANVRDHILIVEIAP